MGLFTETHLGSRYDLFDYKVRTWHTDRGDYHAEIEVRLDEEFKKREGRWATVEERKEFCSKEGLVSKECRIGRNYRDSNPDFKVRIHENREWNADSQDWIPDGRFVLDFMWPYDSDFEFKSEKQDVKQGCVYPSELKKMADFICGFLEKYQNNIWGTTSTTQTKIYQHKKQKKVKKYCFNSQYLFNYYIHDEFKKTEKVDFDFVIKKYDYGIEEFEPFVVEVGFYQLSKKINQSIDIIMTPLQLKEFAEFIYKALEGA